MILDEECHETCETIDEWLKLKEHDKISFEFPNSIDLVPPSDKSEKYMKYLMILFFVFLLWKKRPELFHSLYQILTFNRSK